MTYNIQKQSTLRRVLRLLGGMQIFGRVRDHEDADSGQGGLSIPSEQRRLVSCSWRTATAERLRHRSRRT